LLETTFCLRNKFFIAGDVGKQCPTTFVKLVMLKYRSKKPFNISISGHETMKRMLSLYFKQINFSYTNTWRIVTGSLYRVKIVLVKLWQTLKTGYLII
jgi:hypothetical protein